MAAKCPICLEDVHKQEDIWACYRCECLAHIECMPKQEGIIRTGNGCPGCRYTEKQAIEEAERQTIPPLGVWCSVCWNWIRCSDKVVKCQAPDELCMGFTHTWCFTGRCGACGMSTRQALRERRDRKLELFKTKM